MSWTEMFIRLVIVVCLLIAASACTSPAPREDSIEVETAPVFALDSETIDLTRVEGTESKKGKLKCRTEKPLGSHIPKKICYWEDDLKRASNDARRMMNTINRTTAPN